MKSAQLAPRGLLAALPVLSCLLALAGISCAGRHEVTGEKNCDYGGAMHPHGSSFPSGDGCNSCSCQDGQVACTNKACSPSCSDLITQYGAAADATKACDPQAVNPCTKRIVLGLACGCGTFANPANGDAISNADALQAQYTAQNCQQGIVCGPCREPLSAHCSSVGRCEDDYDEPSCKVGGTVYPSGASDIQDPFSCNKCSCGAGQLGCTNIGCATPCPDGTAPGTSCAECGPTDACTVVEHACLPVCADACDDGKLCVDGLCRNVCG